MWGMSWSHTYSGWSAATFIKALRSSSPHRSRREWAARVGRLPNPSSWNSSILHVDAIASINCIARKGCFAANWGQLTQSLVVPRRASRRRSSNIRSESSCSSQHRQPSTRFAHSSSRSACGSSTLATKSGDLVATPRRSQQATPTSLLSFDSSHSARMASRCSHSTYCGCPASTASTTCCCQ